MKKVSNEMFFSLLYSTPFLEGHTGRNNKGRKRKRRKERKGGTTIPERGSWRRRKGPLVEPTNQQYTVVARKAIKEAREASLID